MVYGYRVQRPTPSGLVRPEVPFMSDNHAANPGKLAWYKQNRGVQCQNVLLETQYSIRMMTMGRGAVGSCVSSSSLVVNDTDHATFVWDARQTAVDIICTHMY